MRTGLLSVVPLAAVLLAIPVTAQEAPTIARQQERVTEHYAYLMANAPEWAKIEIAIEQQAFAAARDACGTDAGCLAAAYEHRLRGLFSWYECLRTDLPLDG